MTDVEPKEFVLAGIVMKRLVSGEQTGGLLGLFENRSDGHTKTPIHVHANDDETVYVIEGHLTAIVDGVVRTLSPGESMFLKRGIPHQLMNPGNQLVRYILIDSQVCSSSFSPKVAMNAARERWSGRRRLPISSGSK